MNNHYTYFLILAAAFAGPFLLSFDKKVAFYTKWKWVFPAMILPAIFYIVWDDWFTQANVWSFNDQYITGAKLHNLPVEELLFFFVVPYCCLFIYECIRCYFPGVANNKPWRPVMVALGAIFAIVGFVAWGKMYTSFTFLFLAIFFFLIEIFPGFFQSFQPRAFFVSYAVILVPFLVVNGFLTAIPVVLYNDEENTGLRIHSIPVEDIFYGMLLILMNVAIFEKLRHRES